MSRYRRLSLVDREELSRLLAAGYSLRVAGHVLSRAPSTLSRELSRHHASPETYRAVRAHQRAQRWAELIKKVYEADPLLCTRCGGAMRIIAFIDQPDVSEKILTHLGLCRISLMRRLTVPLLRECSSPGAVFVRAHTERQVAAEKARVRAQKPGGSAPAMHRAAVS